tara:strand:+ start:534 stop:1385 length:852 start_codon:yes stop_codon:yes gene_type:complete
MNKNLFISTTFAKDNSKISDVLSICEKNGIKQIELGSNHSYDKNCLKNLKKLKFDYLVHNYFPIPKKNFVVNIASQNRFTREKSVKHAFKAIKFCKKINAKLYTIHPGFLEDPISPNKTKTNYDFIWKKKRENLNYPKSFELMINSLRRISAFAKKNKIKIAIETEGSIKKSKLLLMQKPVEYKNFFKYFKPSEVGVNLNIGHLNLSSKAFNFSRLKFFQLIKPYLLAIELSHNNGKEDQHLPIKKNTWYWKILKNYNLKKTYKILEFRNTKIKTIKKVSDYF